MELNSSKQCARVHNKLEGEISVVRYKASRKLCSIIYEERPNEASEYSVKPLTSPRSHQPLHLPHNTQCRHII